MEPSTQEEVVLPVPKLSKNAQKRLKKLEERERTKDQWKEKLRLKRRAAKIRRKEKSSELVDAGQTIKKREKPDDSKPKQGKIIFDLAFDALMKDTEISSLCAQMSRCYAINRRCMMPFELIITGFNGPVSEKIKKSHSEIERWKMVRQEESLDEVLNSFDTSKMIYLSADAEDTIQEIDDDSILIIGGLVDRNRHKGASLERSKKLGIRSMKLPLMENVSLKACPVLTVVHVVDILVKFRDTKSWKESIEAVIPSRKLH